MNTAAMGERPRVPESLGVHYSPAAWRNVTGGYVGHATWRDEYGMATTTYCGHKHFSEESALECITKRHEVRGVDPRFAPRYNGGHHEERA